MPRLIRIQIQFDRLEGESLCSTQLATADGVEECILISALQDLLSCTPEQVMQYMLDHELITHEVNGRSYVNAWRATDALKLTFNYI